MSPLCAMVLHTVTLSGDHSDSTLLPRLSCDSKLKILKITQHLVTQNSRSHSTSSLHSNTQDRISTVYSTPCMSECLEGLPIQQPHFGVHARALWRATSKKTPGEPGQTRAHGSHRRTSQASQPTNPPMYVRGIGELGTGSSPLPLLLPKSWRQEIWLQFSSVSRFTVTGNKKARMLS